MMHSQSQTRTQSPFVALLRKDIRLASQLMLPALGIVAALAVFVAVLPLLGLDAMRSFNVKQETALLQRLEILFPILLGMAIVVPGWIAVTLTFGDAQRRGSTLVSMLPVASRTKWISKLIVAIACTMLFAAFTISAAYANPGPEAFYFENIAWALGIGIAVQLLGMCSGFATAAFTRSTVAAYVLAIGLPIAALLTIVALNWLVGHSAFFLFTTSTAAIRVELGIDFDESPTFRNWVRAHEDLRQIVCLVTLLLCALFCAWRGRGRVAGHGDSTRGNRRTLAWCIATILFAVLIVNSIMTVQISSYYSKFTTELRKQGEHEAQAQLKSTAELVDESRNFTRQFRNTQQCEQILLYDYMAFRSTTSDRSFHPYRPDEPARGSLLDYYALARRLETRPEEVIDAFRAIMHDSAGRELDQRFYAADNIGPEAVIGVALRALVDAATPCERLLAIEELGARIDLEQIGLEMVRQMAVMPISFSDLPPFAFRETDMQFPTCGYRARAIVLVTALRRHCASAPPRASEAMTEALAEFGIDDATLDKCRAILEAPLLESWEPLEREAAGKGEGVLKRLSQLKDCLDCNGSAFFKRAETDPAYLITDR
ncbi:MAG: hypothetical protein DWH96_07830 [Planctomycetota bacterium]|nr:MAG: hypothetical protein DWH96_07830 [Planctomycetota bacterium]